MPLFTRVCVAKPAVGAAGRRSSSHRTFAVAAEPDYASFDALLNEYDFRVKVSDDIDACVAWIL